MAAPAHGGEVQSEADLLRIYAGSELARAQGAASTAHTRSEAAVPAMLANPELYLSHEEARGPAGATTEVVGASVTVDLGLSGLASMGAGRSGRIGGEHRAVVARLEGACAVRRLAVEVWGSQARSAIRDEATDRLVGLGRSIEGRAVAGDASRYEADRTALALAVHQVEAHSAEGQAEQVSSDLSSFVGQTVGTLQLTGLPALPALDEVRSGVVAHPEVLALQHERDAARSRLVAARRAAMPDLSLSGAARWDALPGSSDATPGFDIGGALEIPIFDWSRDSVRAAESESAHAVLTLTRGRLALESRAVGAWHRAEALSTAVETPSPAGIWDGAVERFEGGEASLEELLQVAQGVEDGALAIVERERRLRQARLDLACSLGRFDEPELQAILEEMP